MFRNHFMKVIVAVTAMIALSSVASAALVTFSGFDAGANSTDPRPNSTATAASFDAAAALLGSVSIITFESAPLGAFSNLQVAPGVFINGTDVSSANQTIRNSPFGTPDSLFGYNTTSGGSKFASFFGGTITFTFTGGTSAFGAYLSGVQLTGETITFSDGSSQTVAIPNPGSGGGIAFVGFTDIGKSITSITVNATNDIIAIDDVRYISGANVVPEPGTFLLSGLAIVGLGLLKRRPRS